MGNLEFGGHRSLCQLDASATFAQAGRCTTCGAALQPGAAALSRHLAAHRAAEDQVEVEGRDEDAQVGGGRAREEIQGEAGLHIRTKLEEIGLRSEAVVPTPPSPPSVALAELTSHDFFSDPSGHFAVHEEALGDVARVAAYRQAILANRRLFKGKTVLNVGCGSCLLAMLAAQAGAARVIAMDHSAIVETAREIVEENGLSGVITIVRSRVEELEELPGGVTEVDIILSEWMGFGLFARSSLEAVVAARDRWLAPEGLILPDLCTLHIGAMEDLRTREEELDFWQNVYGLDMSNIATASLQEPRVEVVGEEAVVTTSCLLLEVDLYTCTLDLPLLSSPFHLEVLRRDFLTAFFLYFDVTFSHGLERVVLSTRPDEVATRWKQMVLHLQEDLLVEEGEQVVGMVEMVAVGGDTRDMEVRVRWRQEGEVREAEGEAVYTSWVA